MTIYYAAPDGGGSGADSASPATLITLWPVLNPGDSVFLLDGDYAGESNMIHPPSGLSGQNGNPITIRAFTDGGACFNGQFARIPISLVNNSWFVLEGFDAKNGTFGVIQNRDDSNHNQFRRIVMWDADIRLNAAVFYNINAVNTLVEDCAIFGTAATTVQNGFIFGTGLRLRRVWIRWEGSTTNWSGKVAADMGYEFVSLSVCENCLVTANTMSMPDSFTVTDNNGNESTPAQWGGNTSGNPNCPGLGTRTSVPCPEFFYKHRSGSGNTSTSVQRAVLGSLVYAKRDSNLAVGAMLSIPNNYDLNNYTIRDLYVYMDPSYTRYNSIRAIQLLNHGQFTPTGLSADFLTSVHGSQADFFGSAWSIGSNRSSGSIAAAVQNPWTTTSAANLCTRYVDGVKTTTPLWPWPMNDRIKAATASAGSYAGPCLGCSGGRSARGMVDVTAEIESFLGPIPSGCSSSVGSPPGTGGSARGVTGVDVVNKSEFVALDSGLRLIDVSDTDHATERVRFPFTIATDPADPSQAATRGHALTWLLDASQVTGTGLAPADLRYADLDVEVLDPSYQARIIGDPVVSRELMDTFWGVTEVSGITVVLANADGRLTPLYAADPRDQTVVLRRLDFRSGEVLDQLYARVTSIAMGAGTITITATSPDLSIFEREVPTALVTREAYPQAVDVGAVIPVPFGQVAKLPLPYVKETSVTFEYLVGHGVIVVNGLFYVRTDGTYTKIPADEYEVLTDLYPSYTAIRFPSRRIDITNGSLLSIVADVEGPIRHFVRAIEALLVGPNAWGLNGSAGGIDTAAFDAAAAELDQVGLFCDGVLREQRQVQDVLRDLMIVRGMRLAFTSSGLWTISVDSQRTSGEISLADSVGDGGRSIVSAGARARASMGDAISTYELRYRPDYVRNVQLGTRQRTVNAGFGRNRLIDTPFIRDHATADKVIDYLARRERFGAETVPMTVNQEGRALVEGDLVEVTYAPLQYDHAVLEVRRVTKRLEAIDLLLAGWSDEIYVYGAEPLPTDVITDEGDGRLPAPGGLQSTVDDCAIVLTWNAPALLTDDEEDNIASADVRDYQIEVFISDVLKRVEYTVQTTYTYTLQMNRADTPSGSRTVKFVVRARTTTGSLGNPNTITVTVDPADMS